MADTEKTYNSTGSTTYTFEFEYLKPSDVKVSVAGVPWSEFTIPSSAPTTIQFNTGHVPDSSAGEIRIYRDTGVDNLSATFYAGSAIKSQDLNDNFNQSLFVTQEAKRDIAIAWQDGDDTVHSTETWYTTDDAKIASTKAIQGRLDLKQNLAGDLTNLSSCQTGASGALAALTQAEIEILDGATVSTDELNYVDGVTSNIQTQLDARQDEDALLTAISGKSFRTSTDGAITTDSDTEIPSSKVVATHVTNSISAIGGFEAIADETEFPANEPVEGVIVSIADATDIEVNSSGVATITNGAGSGNNVTINNFPASLRGGNGENANPFPLPNNTGLLVISTGSNHTYNFHRLLPTTDDVKQLSDDVNDFFARYRIANSAPASANDDGDLWWDTSTTESSGRKMQVYDSKYNNNDGTTGRWIDLVTSGEAFINTLTASDASVENGGGSGSFNGTAYRFKLSNPGLTAQHHIVSRAGTIQKPVAGTSQPSEGFAIDGNDIIFASAPVSGTNIFVITIGSALSIGTPSDNTVTSDKIVDGSIVNADINDDADIDGSKIADDTISEVKLDISNAPTNNKVLKYSQDLSADPQVNEMVWGDPDPEGTAVKSTGETTADKVLKTNGSGGASWQVDGPVVTATASGDIATGKPVVLNTDSTVSQIINETKATLGTAVEVSDDDINGYQIVYDPDAKKIIVFWVKEGTSSGNEAIKYKVGTVNASTNAITFGSEQTVVSSIDLRSNDHFDVVYNTASQRYLLVWSPNNDYGRLIAGTYNSSNDSNQGGIDWGSEVNLSGDTSDSSSDVIFTTNALRFGLASATGTTDTRSCLVYAVANNDSLYNNVYAVGIKTNSSNNNLTIGTPESLGNAGADEPSTSLQENIIEHIFDVAYDPDNEIFIAAVHTKYKWDSASNSSDLKNELDCWTIVMDSDADITNTEQHETNKDNASDASLAYDTDLKRFLIFFKMPYSSTVQAMKITVTDDGDGTYNLAIHSQSQEHPLSAIGAAEDSNAFYNPDTKELCYGYRNNWDGYIGAFERKKYGGVSADSSAPDLTVTYSTFRNVGTAVDNKIGSSADNFEGTPLCVYHTDAKKIVAIVENENSSSTQPELSARVIDAGTPFNFNNKYLGFSTSQCNNGNTATIAISGNIATIPNSTVVNNNTLSTTATYYVRGDGILDVTSGDTKEMDWIEAGFAISSTKLLIK